MKKIVNSIENLAEDNLHPGLPIYLAEEIIICRDIDRDGRITFQDVICDSSTPQFSLYAEALAARA